jgi:transketolase
MEANHTSTALILSRQDLPVIDRTKYAPASGALKGAYILADSGGNPQVILIATGSEVQLALDSFETLKQEGIRARVVSMPNWNLFERQSAEYREAVLPSNVHARIAIEAGSIFGWRQFTGLPGEGEVIGMKTFGSSGKPGSLMEEFGFTVENIVKTAKSIIK